MLPVILFAAGTAMQVVGQYQETKAKMATTDYNAAIARSQADQYRKVGEFERARIAEAGAFEAEKLRRQKKRMTGTQRALYAKSGVLIAGSPLEVMADTASQYELDIAVSRYGTASDIALSKYKTEVATRRYGYEARYQNWLSGEYKRAGYVEMAGTLLTGAAAAYGSYGAFKTPTATPPTGLKKLGLMPGVGRRSI